MLLHPVHVSLYTVYHFRKQRSFIIFPFYIYLHNLIYFARFSTIPERRLSALSKLREIYLIKLARSILQNENLRPFFRIAKIDLFFRNIRFAAKRMTRR